MRVKIRYQNIYSLQKQEGEIVDKNENVYTIKLDNGKYITRKQSELEVVK